MSEFVKVGVKKDFPDGQTIGVKVGDVDICVVSYNGQLNAFDDSCTHAHAMLSGSDLDEGDIVCPLHGARFNPTTGDVLTLPAVRPLRKHEVKIEGETVLIKTAE